MRPCHHGQSHFRDFGHSPLEALLSPCMANGNLIVYCYIQPSEPLPTFTCLCTLIPLPWRAWLSLSDSLSIKNFMKSSSPFPFSGASHSPSPPQSTAYSITTRSQNLFHSRLTSLIRASRMPSPKTPSLMSLPHSLAVWPGSNAA